MTVSSTIQSIGFLISLCHATYDETLLTDTYGIELGSHMSALNQGRFYAIQDWGTTNDSHIVIKSWKADSKTTTDMYGTVEAVNICQPFTLSNDDYITGFKIWISQHQTTPTALQFFTQSGNNHSCIGNNGTQTIIYQANFSYNTSNFWYLTGWNIYTQKWINEMQFEFTQFTTDAITDYNQQLDGFEWKSIKTDDRSVSIQWNRASPFALYCGFVGCLIFGWIVVMICCQSRVQAQGGAELAQVKEQQTPLNIGDTTALLSTTTMQSVNSLDIESESSETEKEMEQKATLVEMSRKVVKVSLNDLVMNVEPDQNA